MLVSNTWLVAVETWKKSENLIRKKLIHRLHLVDTAQNPFLVTALELDLLPSDFTTKKSQFYGLSSGESVLYNQEPPKDDFSTLNQPNDIITVALIPGGPKPSELARSVTMPISALLFFGKLPTPEFIGCEESSFSETYGKAPKTATDHKYKFRVIKETEWENRPITKQLPYPADPRPHNHPRANFSASGPKLLWPWEKDGEPCVYILKFNCEDRQAPSGSAGNSSQGTVSTPVIEHIDTTTLGLIKFQQKHLELRIVGSHLLVIVLSRAEVCGSLDLFQGA